MKKEEEKAIRNWCEAIIFVRGAERSLKRLAPMSIEPAVSYVRDDRYNDEIQLYSGIESAAHALKAVIHIDDHSSNTYQKWIVYDNVKFFQIGFCTKARR